MEKQDAMEGEPVNLDALVWQDGGDGEPIPDGSYFCTFEGVEGTPSKKMPDGKTLDPGIRWLFKVNGGPHRGRRLSRITGRRPSEKSGCGQVVAGMLGRTPKPNEPLKLGPCVGGTFVVAVRNKKLEAVSLPPQQ